MSSREADLRTARDRTIVASIRAQLAEGQDAIRVADLGVIGRERAWAIAGSMEAALACGGTFHPPTAEQDGTWWAHVSVPLGRFPQ